MEDLDSSGRSLTDRWGLRPRLLSEPQCSHLKSEAVGLINHQGLSCLKKSLSMEWFSDYVLHYLGCML